MARREARGDVAYWETNNLDEHVALIARQIQRSLDDPETRKLAVKIVSSRPDDERGGKLIVTAWGKPHYLPQIEACAPQSDECESTLLWNFLVQNVRYVLDPDGYDLFSTVKHTLAVGGGDCDDMVIVLAALHRALGFRNRALDRQKARWIAPAPPFGPSTVRLSLLASHPYHPAVGRSTPG
jgi:hypothetical protein